MLLTSSPGPCVIDPSNRFDSDDPAWLDGADLFGQAIIDPRRFNMGQTTTTDIISREEDMQIEKTAKRLRMAMATVMAMGALIPAVASAQEEVTIRM
jgi:hypothetical protein